MKKALNRKGFTLIELMIVVVIIGILAAIAIPRFTAVSEQAKESEAGPILKQMCSLAEAHGMRTGTWPTGAASGIPGWNDPNAEYYGSWTLNNDSTATATKTSTATATMRTPSMNCNTKALTWT